MANPGGENLQRPRLAWRCRRGMRELDVLLSDWLTQRFESSGKGLQNDFARLLECEDDRIWDWVTGRSPAEPDLIELVKAIREHAANRPSS